MKVKTFQFKAEGFGPLVYRTKDNVTHYYQYYGHPWTKMGDESHNLHLVVDEFLKDDVIIHIPTGYISKCSGFNIDAAYLESGQFWRKDCKKLIATTDQKVNEKYGIPLVGDDIVKEYAYEDQYDGLEEVELVTESVYIEPEGIHSNRVDFVSVPKLNEDGEVIMFQKSVEFCEANTLNLDDLLSKVELVQKIVLMKEGLSWILSEYTEKVNESDEIVDKLKELIEIGVTKSEQ